MWSVAVVISALTLKVPITTAADDNFFFFFYFSEKTSLEISCESSAWQTIHMKCQDLFSLKNKKKKIECHLLQILLGTLTLLLLNTTCPVLANSVDPDQLASEEAN